MIRATQFLSAFRRDGEVVCLRAFKPKKAADTPQNTPRKFAVTLNQLASDRKIQDQLRATNQHCGIYFTVNVGGDSDADITRITAWFVENDTLPLEQQHERLDRGPLQPSIRVETRASVHAYWLVSGECNESQWRDIQARLIAYFDGDPKIKNPSRVMRLPNFDHIHINGNGPERQKVTVPTFEPDRRYTVADMHSAFPLPDPVVSEPRAGSSVAEPFECHEDRHAELCERIRARGKRNSKGNWDARALCHGGEGDKGLVYFPASGAVACNKDPKCDYWTILRAEGLPDGHLPSREHAPRKQDHAPDPVDSSGHDTIIPNASPILGEAAMYGIAGDFVAMIGPETEADPVAMLVQFLTIFGNVIGRTAHFPIEGVRHYLNIFACIVGVSSKARKGTGLSYAQRIFERVDYDHFLECSSTGLSSGEGVIAAVRDPTEEKQAIKEKGGQIKEYQTVITDHGVSDKRLLAIETEFASTIARMGREGSSLSAVIRQAWDGARRLKVMTRNNPVTATDAHVSIIAHITKDELIRLLDATEKANGFANRFLFVWSQRSKFLPLGGSVSDSAINALVQVSKQAVDHARKVGAMSFDEEARDLWFKVYPKLSAGKPGLLGVVTSRSEAYVLRLSCLYALLDLSAVIELSHLEAALALWSYCEQSARYVFGDALGDRLADDVLSSLRAVAEMGLTRTELRDLFKRNVDAERMTAALRMLSENGLAFTRREKSSGPRPVERWFASTNGDAS